MIDNLTAAERETVPAKILDRIDFAGAGGCWLWSFPLNANGYGVTPLWHGRTSRLAHRALWEALVGPIPEGMVLDHLCLVRNCLNPDHLDPVTQAENARRVKVKLVTQCRRGHEYTAANTYARPDGYRECQQCRRTRGVERRAGMERSCS